jgi:hypothetical protein
MQAWPFPPFQISIVSSLGITRAAVAAACSKSLMMDGFVFGASNREVSASEVRSGYSGRWGRSSLAPIDLSNPGLLSLWGLRNCAHSSDGACGMMAWRTRNGGTSPSDGKRPCQKSWKKSFASTKKEADSSSRWRLASASAAPKGGRVHLLPS